MIVTCENCEVKYFIDESELGESGRIVRCTFCEHEWLLHCPGHHKKFLQGRLGLFSAAVLYFKTYKWLIICIALCIFAAAALIVQKRRLYWAMEEKAVEYLIAPTLVLDVISYKIEEAYDLSMNDKRKWLLVTVTVRNHDDQPRVLETIRVIGLNYKQEEISHLIVSPEEHLQPTDSTVITIKIPIVDVMPSYVKVLLNKERYIDPVESGQSKSLLKIGNQ
jgi:predicted Zn finger-like uncharacterized protein